MVKTMETTSLNNSSYENFNDLTSDFSVISHPTNEPLLPNGNLDHLQHLHFPAPQIGLTLIDAPVSHHEPAANPMTNSIIHQHLEQILKENMELKEALQQNNLTLRQHFQTLTSWQEQQSKARNRHKQMIDDLQQTTLSLQKDKEHLLAKSEELETTLNSLCTEKEKEIAVLNQAIQEKDASVEALTEEIEKQKVFTLLLQQQLCELEMDRERLEKKLTEESQMVTSPLIIMEEELGYTVVTHPGTSKSDKDHEIERLDSTVQALQEGKNLLMKLLNEKDEDIKDFKGKLEKALDENKTLHAQIEAYKTPDPMNSIVGPPDQRWTLMEAGITSTTNGFEAASICLQKYENRFTSVDQQLSEFQKRLHIGMKKEDNVYLLQELKDEIETLRMLLVSEQESKETDKKSLEEARAKFDALHRDYKYLMKQWHDYQSETQTKDRQMEYLAEIEKRKYQEQLDEVMAKLLSFEENVQDKESEILRLKNRVDILKRETEQLPILRAQVELYQQELHRNKDEKKKNESLLEAQKQEIRTLQAQVVQLMDEINHHSQSQLMEISGHTQHRASPKYQRRSPSMEGQTTSSTSSARRSAERQQPSSNFTDIGEVDQVTECPRCKLHFVGLQAINNHVQLCIFGNETDGNPFL